MPKPSLRGKGGKMRARRLLGLGIAAALLSGCAVMNKEECLMSDWRLIGYEDGARGMNSGRLPGYRKACAKHGVVPDLAAYQQGRSEGLLEYCQPNRGYALGLSGHQYAGVCPSELEDAFLDAYASGRELWTLRSAVSSVSGQIAAKKRTLERVKQEIGDKEALLVGEEATAAQRVSLLAEIRDLSEKRGQLQAEIEELIVERTLREEELYAYEAGIVHDY